MAIVVDYTPIQAVGELAQRAGEASYQNMQAQYRQQQEMAVLQSNLQRQNAEFEQRAQQEAMAEQFQYQSAMLQQKKQIDMELEIADYARNKQKLSQVMNMIRDSEEFSSSEKAQLSLQALSKYADVGQGISSSDVSGGTAMKNMLQQGTFKQQIANTLQQAVESDEMDPVEAENVSRSYGLIAKFPTPQEKQQQQVDKAAKRLDAATKALSSRFISDGKKVKTVINNKPANKVAEGTPEYALYTTLKKQVDDAKGELEKLQNKEAESGMRSQFTEEVSSNGSLQKAVEIYGADKVFEAWKQRQGKATEQTQEEGGVKGRYFFPPYWTYRAGKGLYNMATK